MRVWVRIVPTVVVDPGLGDIQLITDQVQHSGDRSGWGLMILLLCRDLEYVKF